MDKGKINQIIKEKLEAYAPDFEDSAWTEFSPKLQSVQGSIWKVIFRPFLFTGIFLFIAGAFVFLYFQTSEKPDLVPEASENGSTTIIPDSISENDSRFISPEKTRASLSASGLSLDTVPDLYSTDNQNFLKDNSKKESAMTGLVLPSDPASIHPEERNNEPRSENPEEENSNALYESPNKQSKPKWIPDWQDTVSEREAMRYLFVIDDTVIHSDIQYIADGMSDLNKEKSPLHPDLTIGPVVKWLSPIDGFSSTRHEILSNNRAWRFPGFGISLTLNQKFSIGAEMLWSSNADSYIQLPPGYLSHLHTDGIYQHFPGWDEDFWFVLDHIRITTDQLFLPVNLKYTQKVYKGIGLNLKAGVVPHYIRKQNFSYNPHALASHLGTQAAIDVKTWQLSYLQTGLGVNYRISRRFSTYLDGEYWHGIKPIGEERNKYQLMGLSFGVNFHFFPP